MFELRETLIRQIIFAMENQKVRYLVDVDKGVLIREDLVPAEERPDDHTDPEGRYQDIPGWKSADGFFLMEQFVGEIHDPVLRERLQTILVSGSRVFRRFKDTVGEVPDVQRRYYRYKYMAMRDVVVDWYNGLRELMGLEVLELGADEELQDLLLSDITVRVPDAVPLRLVQELDRTAWYEMHDSTPKVLVDYLYEERLQRIPGPDSSAATVVGAYSPVDELVGFVWMHRTGIGGGYTLTTVNQLYVQPEYRGMGIAAALLDHVRNIHAQEMTEGERKSVLLWNGGPDSPALRSLAKSGGFQSLNNTFWC